MMPKYYYNENIDIISQGYEKKLRKVALPSGIYLFKVSNGNTRTICEIYSKLTIKTPELSQ